MLKSALGLLSPAGPRVRLSILIFHRVRRVVDPLFPDELDASRFDAVCGWLRGWFRVLPLTEAVRRLQDGNLPARALAITFDDGYADNHDVGLPILQRHGLTATFFIATGFLDGGRMWNDTIIEAVRRTSSRMLDLRHVQDLDSGIVAIGSDAEKRSAIDRIIAGTKYLDGVRRQSVVDAVAERAQAALPDDLMMTSAQVRRLRDCGMALGGHTVSHPILARLERNEARREIEGGKRALEDLLGEPVSLFAYPNGKPIEDYDRGSVALAREAGFAAAVSTSPGAAGRDTDPFELPRFTPWGRDRLRFGVRLAANLWSSRH